MNPVHPVRDLTDRVFEHHQALLVGISRYEQQNKVYSDFGPVLAARKDAERLRRTLEEIGYSPDLLYTFYDEQATLQNVRGKLSELRLAPRQLLTIVFWAGHGAADAFGRNYLLSWDANPDQLGHTALPVDELITLTMSANARSKAIFLDTCHSHPWTTRWFRPDWRRLELPNVDPDFVFAGASTYFALEEHARGGALTQCLREALRGSPEALCNEEGLVELDGLVGYLRCHVRARASEAWRKADRSGECPQHPFIVHHSGSPLAVGRNISVHLKHVLHRLNRILNGERF